MNPNTLKTIHNWDYQDPIGLIEYIKPIWEEYGGLELTGKKVKKLYMATQGWSGNEEIMDALQTSKSMFFFLWWQKSKRGGHYWFEIKPFKLKKQTKILKTPKIISF